MVSRRRSTPSSARTSKVRAFLPQIDEAIQAKRFLLAVDIDLRPDDRSPVREFLHPEAIRPILG